MVRTFKWMKIMLFGGVVLTGIALLITLYRQNNVPVERVDYVLDTVVVQSVTGKNAVEAAGEAAQYLREFERRASAYQPSSQLSQVREAAGETSVKVDQDLFDLLARTVDLCAASQGVMDITIFPVSSLWDFDNTTPALPDPAALENALSLVGWEDVVLDPQANTVYLPKKGQGIDLGAVAKGYLCDPLSQIYEKHKINYAVVTLGGNVFVYSKDKKGFTVGIRNPDADANSIVGIVSIENQTLATSGAYERQFELDGVQYHHILDTNTGYPVESDLKSVTVIGKDGLLCDFLSTYFFITGTESVKTSLNDERFSIVAIDAENQVYISQKLRTAFLLSDENFSIYREFDMQEVEK